MAWLAVMSAASVEYHEANVVERADDHPGQALDYYGSRGETPLRWAGQLAGHFGLDGEVTHEAYAAVFGAGGMKDPATGQPLVDVKRPGFELVIGTHKSVAVLGVMGRADDMHAILDAEREATMGYLEDQMVARGATRGRAKTPAPTGGLVYAVTRHGTSREGDPHPHDHIVISNITVVTDAKGGYKALDSGYLRDIVEAATMVGRLHGAAEAIRRGYPIVVDNGDSGRARSWRIVGIPDKACALFSKRANQIAEYLEGQGYTGYRARNIAARVTRMIKRHTGVDELMPRWRAELEAVGLPVEHLDATLGAVRQRGTGFLPPMTEPEIDQLTAGLMDPDGDFMQNRKVFTRHDLIAEVAPRLDGHDPAELDDVLDRVVASSLVVPLIPTGPVRDRVYASAPVLANEQTIADTVERLIDRPGPDVEAGVVRHAIKAKRLQVGRPLTPGQQAAVRNVCGPTGAAKVIVGIAGSGKTTALDAATKALERAGYQVLGTATSGQAARTLGQQAGIESRTMRSLLWRLDHGQVRLTDRSVVVLDEAGMTADADLARFLLAIERAGASVVVVGDPRQLPAVGPGGALAAVLKRHPEAVTTMGQNVRQHDPAERDALQHLRHGSVDAAVGFYANRAGRITVSPKRVEALDAMVGRWVSDTLTGHDTIMLAWKRNTVAQLNELARHRALSLGLREPAEVVAPEGQRAYSVGDPVITLQPNRRGELVTSERGMVTAINVGTSGLTIRTDLGRTVTLSGAEIDAEHLDHGYAVTVHRMQGATADRAQYFAEGGGRPLAYVAMSRARERTTVHAVADNIGQAVETIRDDWSRSSANDWISLTNQPDPNPKQGVKRDRITAEIARLTADAPPDIRPELAADRKRLAALEHHRQDLLTGQGQWQSTPEGQAARAVSEADGALRRARFDARTARLLARPAARLAVTRAEHALDKAHIHWDEIGQPAVDRINQAITRLDNRITTHEAADRDRLDWLRDHPDLAHRLDELEREQLRIDNPAVARRLDDFDARRPPPAPGTPSPEKDAGLGL